jgi:hypothetical protein
MLQTISFWGLAETLLGLLLNEMGLENFGSFFERFSH